MKTIQLQLEDSLYKKVLKNQIDIQDKFKEFLFDLTDDGYSAISTEEAKKRIDETVKDYHTNPQNFSKIDSSFWDDTEKRLLQRHA